MTFKKSLMSGVAAIALAATPVLAQEASTDTDLTTNVQTTQSDAEVNAQADTEVNSTLGDDLADAADRTGEAIENGAKATGDFIADTAASAEEWAEDSAQDTAQATDEVTDEAVEETNEMAAEGSSIPSTITAGSLIGTDVKSSDGETIGEVDNVVLVDGKEMAIVGVGGFLGLGEHDVAMPLGDLQWSGEELQAKAYSKAELEGMAEFDPEMGEEISQDEPVMLGRS
ncbi:PRC-barrel domain-containing protein [Pseudooceanicola sp. HF7]|uniref:PRC-barrel domain-containing protein n=1 Tax=Pseudooceanicola sp. HF7 TaxID=2721560 RepID=UPI001431632C|nr:PRC-barrel domain-containing protein [Pseudooceanicola sp. HF7]NIZ09966.1 hypothetical protein [Pseudooceanicola sp. HF7]